MVSFFFFLINAKCTNVKICIVKIAPQEADLNHFLCYIISINIKTTVDTSSILWFFFFWDKKGDRVFYFKKEKKSHTEKNIFFFSASLNFAAMGIFAKKAFYLFIYLCVNISFSAWVDWY